jgi:hypothetical protein
VRCQVAGAWQPGTGWKLMLPRVSSVMITPAAAAAIGIQRGGSAHGGDPSGARPG